MVTVLPSAAVSVSCKVPVITPVELTLPVVTFPA